MKSARYFLSLLALVLLANLTLQAQAPAKTNKKDPVVLTETKVENDWKVFQATVEEVDPAELSPAEKVRMENRYNRLIDQIDEIYHNKQPQAQTKAPLNQVSTYSVANTKEVRI